MNSPSSDAVTLAERAYRIRRNALLMGEVQGQGYIGQALDIADVLAVSYFGAMRYQPDNPEWEGRDRFLLSNGHYAIALYAALFEAGFLPPEELETYGSDDSRLMTRLLAPHRMVTCASPEYLKRHGVPKNVEELAQHSCLHFIHGGRPVDWRFTIDGHVRTVTVNGRFSATNAEAVRDATLAGYGIARLATFLISDDLRSARLQPVLDGYSADGPAVRAVYPSGRHLSPKVRSFIDELLTAWRPEPPWDRH